MNGFVIMALVVLALFYGVYFGKQLAQRRQGIQTNQIGRHKEGEIRRVEYLLALATALLPIAQLLSIAMDWSLLPNALRCAGFAVGLAGDAVFIVAVARRLARAGPNAFGDGWHIRLQPQSCLPGV